MSELHQYVLCFSLLGLVYGVWGILRMNEKRNRRNRERRNRRTVYETEWCCDGRVAIKLKIRQNGEVLVRVLAHAHEVAAGDRERAAEWLSEFFPRLTHDQRYEILWG